MLQKLFFVLCLSMAVGVGGCSKPAQEEGHAPEEIERAVDEAQEQANQVREAANEAAE